MKIQTILLSALLFFVCAGCGSLRIFQKKVPSNNSETPKEQVQAQRRAASLIVKQSAPPVANPEQAVQQIHEVAAGLSASLGEPEIPVKLEDQAAVIAELRTGLIAKEKQLEAWKAFGRKYAGKQIEDTGLDLSPFLGWGGLLAVIAACIFIPGFGWVLLRFVPVVWGMLRRVATGVEGYVAAHPEAGQDLKQNFLSKTLNEVDKRIIAMKKKSIPEAVVTKLATDAVPVAA